MDYKYLDCDFQPCELYTSADSNKCEGVNVRENFDLGDYCNRSCDMSDTKTICGTDGITYPNICKLQERSCETQGQVQYQHNGQCSPGQPRVGQQGPQAVYGGVPYPGAALPSMSGQGTYWNFPQYSGVQKQYAKQGLFLGYQ